MRHFFLNLGLAHAVLLLTGAFDQRVLTDPPAYSSFLPQSAEAAGGSLLDEVIAAHSPERVQWLRMTVLQKNFDANFQSEGRFLLGPDCRRRLELEVHGDTASGKILAVSDARTLCQARWIKGAKADIARSPLPENDPPARHRCLQENGLGGPSTLLEIVRQHLSAAVKQEGICQGRKAIRLSGAWNPDANLKTFPAGLSPTHCAIYLDAESLWPFRIEWLGCQSAGNRQVLLLQMDFRDPVINQPLSTAAAAEMFSTEPGVQAQ